MNIGPLLITGGFDSNKFDLLWPKKVDELFKTEARNSRPEDQLISLANFWESGYDVLLQCIEIPNGEVNAEAYLMCVNEQMLSLCGPLLAEILSLDAQYELFTATTDNGTCDALLQKVHNALRVSIEQSCAYAHTFCDAIMGDAVDRNNEIKAKSFLVNAAQSILSPNICYHPIPAIEKKTGKFTVCDSYTVKSTMDGIALLFFLTIKLDVTIRKCKLCGQFFLPVSKKDEIYCQHCRKVTYDMKIKEDEIRASYRKIYKTQNARKRRNSHIPGIENRFEIWAETARQKLTDCIGGNISLEQMTRDISLSDWMYQRGEKDGNN